MHKAAKEEAEINLWKLPADHNNTISYK